MSLKTVCFTILLFALSGAYSAFATSSNNPSHVKLFAFGSNGGFFASPDSVHWNFIGGTQHGIGVNETLLGIVLKDNKYLAVTNKHVYDSKYGFHWFMQRESRGGRNIISDGKQFIVFSSSYPTGEGPCNGSLICASKDGTTWYPLFQGNPPFEVGYDMAYGDGKYVLISHYAGYRNYFILTSTDSKNWLRIPEPDFNLLGVGWGNHQFVAVGGKGSILTSMDGVTWVYHGVNAAHSLWSVTWGHDKFVAVGGEDKMNGQACIWTSSDGVSWTQQKTGVSLDFDTTLNRVAWINKQFIAVGANGIILTSPDGISWTRQNTNTTHYHFYGVVGTRYS